MSAPAVSIVVCTHGERQRALARLIVSLAWQTMPFELVIVLGPASAETRAFVERLPPTVRRTSCDTLNISRARNAGIRAAGGDTIVFIDDDAVPTDHRWLETLTAPLRDAPGVAAVGGPVYHRDSGHLEFAGGATSACGFQRFDQDAADGEREVAPDGTPWLRGVPGGNCAFTRRALEAIGGFDEEFAYYLDETDVCHRLVEAGFRIEYAPAASIRHFAAGSSHGPAGYRNRARVARSDACFVVRHAPGPRVRRIWLAARFHGSKHFVREGRVRYERGELTAPALVRHRLICWRGLLSGIIAGLRQPPPAAQAIPSSPPWQRYAPVGRRVLVLDPPTSPIDGDESVVAIVSTQPPDREATLACWIAPPPIEVPALDIPALPDLARAATEAAYWAAVLVRLELPQANDELSWPRSAITGALIAEALRRATDGVPPPSALAGGWLLDALARRDPDGDIIAAVLPAMRYAIRDHQLDLAIALGAAIGPRLGETDPRRPEIDYHLAHALRDLGRIDEARDLYEYIRGRRSAVAPHLVAGACFHLANDARGRHEHARAIRLLTECLDYVPEHAAARRLLDDLERLDPEFVFSARRAD